MKIISYIVNAFVNILVKISSPTQCTELYYILRVIIAVLNQLLTFIFVENIILLLLFEYEFVFDIKPWQILLFKFNFIHIIFVLKISLFVSQQNVQIPI